MDTLYFEATNLDQNFYEAKAAMLSYLSPKWGGNSKDYMDFAEEIASKSGDKSKDEVGIILANWETAYGYYEGHYEDYFQKPDVMKQINFTMQKLQQKFPNSPQLQNIFARTAYYSGDKAKTKKLFFELQSNDKIMMSEWPGGRSELTKVRRDLAKFN